MTHDYDYDSDDEAKLEESLKDLATKLGKYEEKNNKEAWRWVQEKFKWHDDYQAIEMSDLEKFFTGTILNLKRKEAVMICKAFEMRSR